MKCGPSVAYLLLLFTATVQAGSDASDGVRDEAAVQRVKRWSGLSIFDSLRGKGASTRAKPAVKPTRGDGFLFDLSDAARPGKDADAKPSSPSGGNGFSGFSLEDALRPAVKPSDEPSGENCQRNLIQKLSSVLENQDQQLRLLLRLTARSSSARP